MKISAGYVKIKDEMTFLNPLNLIAYFSILLILLAFSLIIYLLNYYFRMVRAYRKQLVNPEDYKDKRIHKLLRVYHVEREVFPEGESFVLAYAKKDESLIYALKMKIPSQKGQRIREYDLIRISGTLEGKNIYIGRNVKQSHAPFVLVKDYKKK